MKNLVTFFTVCFFATTLIGCSKGLSGTYKHDGSGRIIEFKSSTAFNIRYPDSTVVAGTYKKTKEGYEFSMAGGLVFAVVKKEGKSFVVNGDLYVKQKGKTLFYLTVIYLVVLLLSIILNIWNSITTKEEPFSAIFFSIFWPIFLAFFLVVLIPLLIITDGELIDVT